ncbi:BA75_02953T0 [Komagataella pastoris]|uniref:BA75_02953T0 n=1 Tax=Komagataella pastoris TaxID=4922 RepID=A0A1B2JDB0_PICPA|nr:BA75_02953T0 [Komagataella pastoris]
MSSEYKTKGGNSAFHNHINDFAHIQDPKERRRLALQSIDNAKFSWYHVRAIAVAGVGFMTDAYDIFAINLGLAMLVFVYWGGSIPDSTQTLLKVSTSVGTVIGQLGFGWAADFFGRKKIYGLELVIMIFATVLQCTVGESKAISFPAILTFYRIVMGIGIGGDYPMSSIISSEFSSVKWRGLTMGAVFANQGWGQLLAGLVALICIAGYKDDLVSAKNAAECGYECQKACDQMWRILIGFGCVPGVIALYFRLTIPESPRYTFDVTHEIEKAACDTMKFTSGLHGAATEDDIVILKNAKQLAAEVEKETLKKEAEEIKSSKVNWHDFYHHYKHWRHGKILIGTAGSWFMLDIAYYGLGLNTAVILQTIGYAKNDNVYEKLFNSAAGNLILICAGSIPGYWFTAFTCDTFGRKPLQIVGFILLTMIFCIIGFGYHKIGEHGLLGCYIVAQFLQNLPNTTTFIVPGECFPTKFRSTSHGISAAAGKVGAIIAQTVIGTLTNHGCSKEEPNCFLPHVMEIFALFMLLGTFTSLLIPETKRKSLEQLSYELHGDGDDPESSNSITDIDSETNIIGNDKV